MLNLGKNTLLTIPLLLLTTLSCFSKIMEQNFVETTQNTFIVSSLKEFVDALGHDRILIIDEDIFITRDMADVLLDTARFIDSSKPNDKWFSPLYKHEFYNVEGTYISSVDTKESLGKDNFKPFLEKGSFILTIKNIKNLTITSNNGASIVANQPEDEVIRFDSVQNLHVQNMSIYHETLADGGCGEYAPVISIFDSNDILINKCKLNGSGTEGVYAKETTNLTIYETAVYNCTRRGLMFDTCKNVQVKKCRIYENNLDADAEYYTGPAVFYLIDSHVKVMRTKVNSNTSVSIAPFVRIDETSTIHFSNCSIEDNQNFVLTEQQKEAFNITSW